MSIKKRVFNFLTAMVMVFGSAPMFSGKAFADTTDCTPSQSTATVTPEHTKTVSNNGDGTYTVTLTIYGKGETTTKSNKANVIIVADTSWSMTSSVPENQTTRLASMKTSLNSLVETLLDNNVENDESKKDLVEVELISFNSSAEEALSWTTNKTTAKNAINNLSVSRGTNWEAALELAYRNASARAVSEPDDTTYIIFASDGEPSNYLDDGGNVKSGNANTSYAQARDYAKKITDAGYYLYNLGVYDTSITTSNSYMQQLTTYANSNNKNLAFYYAAQNESAVNAAFREIVSSITNSLTVTNMTITDGVTDMAQIAEVSGGAADFKYYKNGGIWTDAPVAIVNENNEVVWNLGSTELKNGETAAISFVVWPEQEVLDAIAELESAATVEDEEGIWNSLDTKIQETIERDGEGFPKTYKFRTNKQNPTLTYTVKETVENNGTTTTTCSDGETTFENPEPQEIDEPKLSIVKEWEAGMDENQINDYDGSVSFDLYRSSVEIEDGKFVVKDEEKYRENITLTNDNDWKIENYLTIAPGIMVSEEHNAYADAIGYFEYSGITYGVLDTGHVYRFDELDQNVHFDLINYIYHPMWVDGELKNVVISGGEITNIEDMPMTNNTAKFTVVNQLKGGAVIEKILIDNDGNELESDQEFTFNAILKDSSGNDYGEFTYRIYYGKNNPNYSETGENRSAKLSGNTSLEGIEIYAGDRIMFTDLETGAWFYAEENDSDLPVGFEIESEENKIERYNSDATRDAAQAKEFDGKTYYKIEGNASTQYIVTNAYYTGDLSIEKTVKNINGDAEKIEGKEFEFIVDLYADAEKTEKLDGEYEYSDEDETKTGTIKSGGKISLTDGEKITISELPKGTYYEVSEAEQAGFTATTNGNETGTIEKAETQVIEFTNEYEVANKTAKIQVFKGFDNFWFTGDEFTFEISAESDDAPMPQETTAITSSALTPAEFEITLDKYFDEELVYTITEIEEGFRTGVSRVDDDEDVIVTLKTADNGDGTLDVIVKYAKGATEDRTIYNTYAAEGDYGEEDTDTEGALTFEKIVIGREEWGENETYTFELYEDGELIDTATATSDNHYFSFSALHFTLEDLGEHVYTIVETAINAENVSAVTEKIEFTLVVEDQHDGTLLITPSEDYARVFYNQYIEPGQGGVAVENPYTFDDGIMSYYVLAILAMFGLITPFAINRRKYSKSLKILDRSETKVQLAHNHADRDQAIRRKQ